MKRLTIFTAGLLLAGVWSLGKALKTKEDTDFAECDEDSFLITPPECPTEEILYFPFPYKCYQFFQCFNFEAICIRCPPGTIWDQANTNCVPGSATNCTIVTTPAPTTTTDPDDPINWVCPERYDGLIRHPFDCQFYYSCDPYRRPCLLKCADGLYFNPESGYCDFPFNLPDCRGGSPPPPSSTPSAQGSSERKTLNYRNVNRQNITETIRYLSKWYKSGSGLEKDPDLCEIIKIYLEV